MLESNEEQIVTGDIERDLADLHECIQQMRQGNGSILTNQQEAWIKRYYEIHFDYSSEFRNTSASIQRKRESMELMNSSRKLSSEEKDSSMSKLLKEKMSIAASMRSINEVLSQAFETKNSLLSQRSSLSNASGGLGNITNSVPGIGRLIDGIQKKKYRETLIIGGVVAVLICFTIWYVIVCLLVL